MSEEKKADGVNWFLFWIVIFVFLVLFGIRSCQAEQDEKRHQAQTWTVVAAGVYDRAEYGTSGRISHSSHGSDRLLAEKFTVIVFADGSTFVMEKAHHSVPFPKGTAVLIKRNGLGVYVIEKK